MQHEILYNPSFSFLKVKLDSGEALKAEAGAMVSMSHSIEIETKMQGSMFGALKKKVLGGESMFINTFKATDAGEATFAPGYPGDIVALDLNNTTLFTQSGAYMASGLDIEIDTKFGGAKTFFSREGFFLLKITGSGKLFLSTYGACHKVTLGPGEKYVVDTGHMVAFDEQVNYEVKKVGNWKSTLLSGEGLVVHLTGPGDIYLQTRSLDSFVSWLLPRMPTR